MVMRRILATALEALEDVTKEASGRPRVFPDERFSVSEFIPARPPRPAPEWETVRGDEDRQAGKRTGVTVASPRRSRRAGIRQQLSSRAGVQQALVVQEIVGPPKALRPWDEDLG